MAQDEAYDVRVVGRRTDDQGRTLVQETFWYKGSFYMTDRYERADESTEKKAVEDALSAPPNPAEDEPVGATAAAEVPTLPVEAKPAGCNLVEKRPPHSRLRLRRSVPAPTTTVPVCSQ